MKLSRVEIVVPHDPIIHVVDPDSSIGEALSALMETYQISVRVYPDAESFLKADLLKSMDSSCLLTEISLPGLSGLSLLQELRDQNFDFPVIMLTDIASKELHARARNLGATDVLEKPLMSGFLLDRIKTTFSL